MFEEMQKFEKWLKANSRSENTIRSYVKKIKSFLSHCHNTINKESIEDFIIKLKDDGKSPSTINAYRASISSYLDFKDLAIRLPRSSKIIDTIPDVIDKKKLEDEIIPMIQVTSDKPEKAEAIFRLIFSCGLRPSEIVALKRKDCNFETNEWKYFRKKVNKEDIAFLDEETIYALRVYFASDDEQKNAFNITERGIGKMFDRLKEYFPDIKLRPYLLRHSSATSLLEEGMSLMDIKETLGHKRLNSTEKYLKVNKQKLKEKFLKIRNKK